MLGKTSVDIFTETGVVPHVWWKIAKNEEEWEKLLNRFVKISDNKNGGKVVSDKTSFTVSAEKRERFLIGVAGVAGWSDDVILKRELGLDNVIAFMKRGIVPPKWIKILQGYDGGMSLLKRYKDVSKSLEHKTAISASNNPTKSKLPAELKEKMFEKYGDSDVLRREYASHVLKNIKKMTKFKTNKSIGNAIDKSSAMVSQIGIGRCFWHLEYIEAIAEKSGVSIEDLLTFNTDTKKSFADRVYSSGNCDCPDNSKRENVSALCEKEFQEFLEEINRIVQSGLLNIGGVSKNRKTLFCGYLLRNLSEYSLQFNNNSIRFKKDNLVYVLKLDHLNF